MRVVCDTNVVVSAVLLDRSVSADCFRHALESHELLSSHEILLELFDVLQRERLNRYTTEETRLEFFRVYAARVTILTPQFRVDVCRDPDDNRLLEAATEGKADMLITGDQDLLVLRDQFAFRIITPREYVEEQVRR